MRVLWVLALLDRGLRPPVAMVPERFGLHVFCERLVNAIASADPNPVLIYPNLS